MNMLKHLTGRSITKEESMQLKLIAERVNEIAQDIVSEMDSLEKLDCTGKDQLYAIVKLGVLCTQLTSIRLILIEMAPELHLKGVIAGLNDSLKVVTCDQVKP